MDTVHLSWKDRHGAYHPIPLLGSGNCNWKRPQLETDFGYINDMALLPIKGIRYGPLKEIAGEQVNITIGPLECSPIQKPYYNITAEVETLHNECKFLC